MTTASEGSICSVEGCKEERYARFRMCRAHVNERRRAKHAAKRGAPVPVFESSMRKERQQRNADVKAGVGAAQEFPPVLPVAVWPDSHRNAPTGSRLVRWLCPACGGGKTHLSGWPAMADEPGLKVCPVQGQMGRTYTFHVLAPDPSRIFDAEPASAEPERSEHEPPPQDGDQPQPEVTLR